MVEAARRSCERRCADARIPAARLGEDEGEEEAQPSRFMTDGFSKLLDPEGYPGIQPPWGTLNAIDLDTGEYAWSVPLGEYPQLAAQGLVATGHVRDSRPAVHRDCGERREGTER